MDGLSLADVAFSPSRTDRVPASRAGGRYRRQVSLRAGLRIVAAVLLVLFVAVGILVFTQIQSARSAQTEVQSVVDPASTVSQRLLSDYINQETGERGYIITGDPSFLQPYTQGHTAAASGLRPAADADPGRPAGDGSAEPG